MTTLQSPIAIKAEQTAKIGALLAGAVRSEALQPAERRLLARTVAEINRLRTDEGLPAITDPAALAAYAADKLEELSAAVTGGSFILDASAIPKAIWGSGREVLWGLHQPMIVWGPAGVGKSTMAQQVVMARLGLVDNVLGFPVATADKPILYVAADRPTQIASSMRRMVTESARPILDDMLQIWKGPPPQLITDQPSGLLTMAQSLGCGTIVVDSLMDCAGSVASDESGSAIKQFMSLASAAEVDLLIVHHDRKRQQGVGMSRRTLADMYGSRYIGNGAGTAFLIDGNGGDPILKFSQQKSADGTSEIGPYTLSVDHSTGTFSISTGTGLLERLRLAPQGLSTREAAKLLYATADPSYAEKEKARRKLQKLVDRGLIHPKPVDSSPNAEVRYYAVEDRLI